jgi:hypothetical protein
MRMMHRTAHLTSCSTLLGSRKLSHEMEWWLRRSIWSTVCHASNLQCDQATVERFALLNHIVLVEQLLQREFFFVKYPLDRRGLLGSPCINSPSDVCPQDLHYIFEPSIT